jgi:hypothetical protein
MPDPGDVVGQAAVNVRTCVKTNAPSLAPEYLCAYSQSDHVACPGCQGDGTWLDTSDPTMVERVTVYAVESGDLAIGLDYYPDDYQGAYFRPVENGDTDG